MDSPGRQSAKDRPGVSRPRSILKKDRAKNRRSLVWDESNLSLNEKEKTPKMKIDEPKTPYHHSDGYMLDKEADEEIEGPPGPSPPEARDAGLMDKWDEVVTKMEKVSARRERGSLSRNSSWSKEQKGTGSGDDSFSADEKGSSRASESGSESDGSSHKRKEDFSRRRKAHYNEFQILKKLQSELSEDEEANEKTAPPPSSNHANSYHGPHPNSAIVFPAPQPAQPPHQESSQPQSSLKRAPIPTLSPSKPASCPPDQQDEKMADLESPH